MSPKPSTKGASDQDQEDLFDFASVDTSGSAPVADEIDIEAFLSAVGDIDEAEDGAEADGAYGRDSYSSSKSLEVSSDLRGKLIGSKKSEKPPVESNSRAGAATRRTDVPAGPLLVDLPWSVLIGGALMITLNAWLVFTIWRGQFRAEESLQHSRQELERAAEAVATRIGANADRIERATSPRVAPQIDGTQTLAHVQRSLELEDFALARRQLYALLSVVDRLTPERRVDIEARANYMLADVDRLEAQARRAQSDPRAARSLEQTR